MDISEVLFEFTNVEALADEKVAAIPSGCLLMSTRSMHRLILLHMILSISEQLSMQLINAPPITRYALTSHYITIMKSIQSIFIGYSSLLPSRALPSNHSLGPRIEIMALFKQLLEALHINS